MGRPAEPPRKPIKDGTRLARVGHRRPGARPHTRNVLPACPARSRAPLAARVAASKEDAEAAAESPRPPPLPCLGGAGRRGLRCLALARGPAPLRPLALTAGCGLQAPMQNCPRDARPPVTVSQKHVTAPPPAPPQTVQPCVITRQQGLFPCTWPVFQTTLHSAGQKRPFTAGPGSECDPGKLPGDGDVSARRRLPSWACTSRTAGPRWPHAEGGRDGQHRK